MKKKLKLIATRKKGNAINRTNSKEAAKAEGGGNTKKEFWQEHAEIF